MILSERKQGLSTSLDRIMLSTKSCFWIVTLVTFIRGTESTVTWVGETTISNGLSLAGRITTIENVNLGQCIVECYMDESCITVGVSESVGGCQLYDLDLEDHQYMTAQADTAFYKAVCDNRAYTYVRKLNKCIRRSSGQVTFPDARASCQADGGDLLMVKDEATRLYLKDIMTSVTGTRFYWLGATEDPGNHTLWYWVDGTQMTEETGWSFWKVNNPTVGHVSVYLQIIAGQDYGDVYFNDKGAGHTGGFFCELSP